MLGSASYKEALACKRGDFPEFTIIRVPIVGFPLLFQCLDKCLHFGDIFSLKSQVTMLPLGIQVYKCLHFGPKVYEYCLNLAIWMPRVHVKP